jgi:ribonuclease-3
VLGFVVADLLYREFPHFQEGQKSKAKAALVSTAALAELAQRIGLGAYLLLGRGEEKTGGRQKQALLADGCEAVIAAVYLDGGVEAARNFILGSCATRSSTCGRPISCATSSQHCRSVCRPMDGRCPSTR